MLSVGRETIDPVPGELGEAARRKRLLLSGYETLRSRLDRHTHLVCNSDLRANARFCIFALAQNATEASIEAERTLLALLSLQYPSGPNTGGWPRSAGGAHKSDWANFITVDLTHIYYAYGGRLSKPTLLRLLAAFERSIAGNAYRPNNPRNNHQANAVNNKILVGQILRNQPLIADGLINLRRLIDKQISHGMGEWDSPTYWYVWVRALANLWSFVADLRVKYDLGLFLEFLLLDRLADYMPGGYYPGAHSRVYGGNVGTDVVGTTGLDYLWVGDFSEPLWPTPVADLPYSPPEYLKRFALDRQRRIENREHHEDQGKVWNKHTLITPEYSLGGVVPYYPRWHNLQHTWDLTIRMRHRSLWHTLFTMNPGDGYDVRYDPTDPFIGESPYQVIYPHGDALIARYDIPADHPYPYIVGAIPLAARVERFGQWVILMEERTLAALGIAQEFTLDRQAQFWKVHSPGCQNAVVVQAASVDRYPGAADPFLEFAAEIRTRTIQWEPGARVAFETLSGDKLLLEGGREPYRRTANGKAETFQFEIFEGQGITLRSKVLTAEVGGVSRTIDFNSTALLRHRPGGLGFPRQT